MVDNFLGTCIDVFFMHIRHTAYHSIAPSSLHDVVFPLRTSDSFHIECDTMLSVYAKEKTQSAVYSVQGERYSFFVPQEMTPNEALIICCQKTILTSIRVFFVCHKQPFYSFLAVHHMKNGPD